MPTFVNPLDEGAATARSRARRLDGLEGKTLALLDISKPGGSIFLDRLEHLLVERYGVSKIVRASKPTYTKPAPAEVLEGLRFVDGVIEALAD
jgi:hypothetical protein